MENLSKKIGFKSKTTATNEIDEEDMDDVVLDDIEVKDNNGFTPHFKKFGPPPTSDPLSGISIRNLPKDVKIDEIEILLENQGIDSNKISVKQFQNSASADIKYIDDKKCKKLIEVLNNTEVLTRKIKVKGIKCAAMSNDKNNEENQLTVTTNDAEERLPPVNERDSVELPTAENDKNNVK